MKKRALLYIIIASVLWGTSGLFVHALVPFGFSSIQMTALRGIVSAVAFVVYALLRDRTLFRTTAKEFFTFALSGVFIFGTASSYYASMQASSVSTAVVLMYTAPIFVMAFSVAFFGEKMNFLKGLSVVCMLIGCALVSGVIGGMTFNPVGILFGLASGVLYSAYNIFAKIEMMHHSNPVSASLYCFLVMGIVAFVCSNPPELFSLIAQAPSKIIPLGIGIGICTSVLPYFLYTLSLRDLPAGTATTLGIIEPMAATVFSVAFLGERLSVLSVCGILLILGAVMILNKAEANKGESI